jgi:hypothetical protein
MPNTNILESPQQALECSWILPEERQVNPTFRAPLVFLSDLIHGLLESVALLATPVHLGVHVLVFRRQTLSPTLPGDRSCPVDPQSLTVYGTPRTPGLI